MNSPEMSLTFGQRLSDKISAFLGSWGFVIIQTVLLGGWMILNTAAIIANPPDPYPFMALNTFLGMFTSYTGPFVVMSDNRQAARHDQQMAHIEGLANSIVELEQRQERWETQFTEQLKQELANILRERAE